MYFKLFPAKMCPIIIVISIVLLRYRIVPVIFFFFLVAQNLQNIIQTQIQSIQSGGTSDLEAEEQLAAGQEQLVVGQEQLAAGQEQQQQQLAVNPNAQAALMILLTAQQQAQAGGQSLLQNQEVVAVLQNLVCETAEAVEAADPYAQIMRIPDLQLALGQPMLAWQPEQQQQLDNSGYLGTSPPPVIANNLNLLSNAQSLNELLGSITQQRAALTPPAAAAQQPEGAASLMNQLLPPPPMQQSATGHQAPPLLPNYSRPPPPPPPPPQPALMSYQHPGLHLPPPRLQQQQPPVMISPVSLAHHQQQQQQQQHLHQLLGPPPFMGGPPQFVSLAPGFPGGLFTMPGFPSYLTLPRLPAAGPPPPGFYVPAQQQQLLAPEGFTLLPGYGPCLTMSQPASPLSSSSSSSSYGSLAGTPPSSGSLKRKASIPPSPEQSPQGPYIGQHSQGLGGHYADSYWNVKRQKRS